MSPTIFSNVLKCIQIKYVIANPIVKFLMFSNYQNLQTYHLRPSSGRNTRWPAKNSLTTNFPNLFKCFKCISSIRNQCFLQMCFQICPNIFNCSQGFPKDSNFSKMLRIISNMSKHFQTLTDISKCFKLLKKIANLHSIFFLNFQSVLKSFEIGQNVGK